MALHAHSYDLKQPQPKSYAISRRHALASSIASLSLPIYAAGADTSTEDFAYELRDRKGNKQSVIKEDYWYMMGRTPPRRLDTPLRGDDPQWNAFGSCSSDGFENSCTYVSLKQRAPAYSKYAFPIADGAREFAKLGTLLKKLTSSSSSSSQWQEAAQYFLVQDKTPPPPILDAELKMVLLATALFTSPNFPGPGKELLVARFYVNEIHFSSQEIAAAIADQDAKRALQAWEFGKDSWNSYFQVVNRPIVPKVGDKFEFIAA